MACLSVLQRDPTSIALSEFSSISPIFGEAAVKPAERKICIDGGNTEMLNLSTSIHTMVLKYPITSTIIHCIFYRILLLCFYHQKINVIYNFKIVVCQP